MTSCDLLGGWIPTFQKNTLQLLSAPGLYSEGGSSLYLTKHRNHIQEYIMSEPKPQYKFSLLQKPKISSKFKLLLLYILLTFLVLKKKYFYTYFQTANKKTYQRTWLHVCKHLYKTYNQPWLKDKITDILDKYNIIYKCHNTKTCSLNSATLYLHSCAVITKGNMHIPPPIQDTPYYTSK